MAGKRIKKARPQREQERQKPLLVERWPQALHRTLRAEAAMQGRTFRAVLIEAAQDWLKRKGRT